MGKLYHIVCYIFQAAGVLAKLDYRISSGEEARKLDGIGDKISKKIDEFIQTGKLNKLEKVQYLQNTKSIIFKIVV